MMVNHNGENRHEPETELIVAVDIGTTKVCTLIGRGNSSAKRLEILGYGVAPSTGLQKGVISDKDATINAIRESLRNAEKTAGCTVKSVFVGVTGSHVNFENRRDRLNHKQHDVITTEVMNRPIETPNPTNGSERQVIHSIKMSYVLDGQTGIRNPIGMHSQNLEVDTHIVTGDSEFLKNLEKTVLDSGVHLSGLVLEPLASGLSVLTPEEKEKGTLIIDIGGGTSDLVFFKKGQVCYTGVIPVGGYQFTNDIAVTFDTSYREAEAAKLKFGGADRPNLRSNHCEISLPVKNSDLEVKINSQEISKLTKDRAHELVRLLKLKLQGNKEQLNPSLVVLTGGTSNLPGFVQLVKRTLSVPVRQGIPTTIENIPETLKNPAYSTSVGILIWALTEQASIHRDTKLVRNSKNRAGSNGLHSSFITKTLSGMTSAIFASRK